MSNFNLTISPSQIEFVLKPGTTITQAYEITNNSFDRSIVVNTEVLPWYPQGNDGSVNYQNIISHPNIFFSLSNSNIKLNKSFTLAPRESKQLVLQIKTDSNAELSDAYYTFFVYQDQNTTKSTTSLTQTSGKIGSHILLSLSKTAYQPVKADIKKFFVTPKIKDVFFSPLTFDGEVQNNTNYFFKTIGKITVTKNNKNIKELELNPNNVLAHHYRRFSCSDQETCTIRPPFWPGKYTATISFDPDFNIKPAETSFYVLPISPILFLLFLIGCFFGYKFIKNKINSKS